MKTLVRLAFAALFFPLFATAQESEIRDLSGFSYIETEGNIAVDLVQADDFEVIVLADGAETEDLETTLIGRDSNTLILELADSSRRGDRYSATISMPELRGFQIRGSGRANLGDFEFDDLRLAIGGSGDIETAQLTGKDLAIDVAGSGEISLDAIDAESVELKVAGAGEVDISQISAQDMSAKIAGAGDIAASGDITNLSIVIAGSGDFDGDALRVENLQGVIAGGGDVDISEVVNGEITNNGDLADLIGLGLDMRSMFEDVEEIEIDFDSHQEGQRSGRNPDRDSSFLEDLIPFGAFAVPIIIVALCVIYEYRKKRLQHETLQKFAESNQPIPDHVMELLSPKEKPKSTMQSGVNLIALGLGIAAFFLIIGSERAAALGCIPGFIGIAKLLVWHLESK